VTLPRINGKEDWEGQWREQWRVMHPPTRPPPNPPTHAWKHAGANRRGSTIARMQVRPHAHTRSAEHRPVNYIRALSRQDEPGDTTFIKGEWIYPERQEPIYQSVPLDTELTLQAGERRGFLIHTSCKVGVANRWPIGRGFAVGQKTGLSLPLPRLASLMRILPCPLPRARARLCVRSSSLCTQQCWWRASGGDSVESLAWR